MKAVAVFPKTRVLKIVDRQEPEITHPQQVKLRMLDIGVCGTDKEICLSGFGTAPESDDYLILGHESLGEVVEVGAEVHNLKPGDLVVPIVRHPCAHDACQACRAGRQDFCQTDDYTERGIRSEHGYMAEYVVDEARFMNFVPAHLRDVGVLVEPLTVAEKALSQMLDMQQRLPWFKSISPEAPGKGLKALVLGAGPIGILGAMLLQISGFETYVYSRSLTPNPKAATIEAIGAKYISTQEVSVEQLIKKFGSFDLVYEALGASPIVFEVMAAIGHNGVFIFTGVPEPTKPTTIDTAHMLHKLVMHNQILCGTVNADPASFATAIQHLDIFMQRWPQAVRSLITRYPVENFENVLLGKVGGIKNALTFSTL